MSAQSGQGSSSAPSSAVAPWYAGPLFHFLTGTTALAAAVLWLHLGGDPTLADGAFGGGIAFLGVGVGVAASA